MYDTDIDTCKIPCDKKMQVSKQTFFTVFHVILLSTI